MKLARLSALSAAIMMISTAQGNAFVDDASLDIHLRNYYKNDGVKNAASPQGKDDSHSQWAQAVRINFSSGYFNDLVGIDLGAHHALKLRGDKGSNNGLLAPAGNGSVYGFGKTSYAIKVNLMDMGVAKYGRMFIDTPLLSDDDARALPSLTEGFYAEGAFDALGLYGIVAMKNNPLTQSGFSNYGYVNENGDTEKKSVQIIGGTYDFGHGISTHIAYGRQKEASKRYYATVNYATNIDNIGLDLGIQYGKNKLTGLAEEQSNTANWDTSQHAWGAIATASMGAASLGLAYTAVQKSTLNSDGNYVFQWGTTQNDVLSADSSTYFGYNASQYSDFNRGGQKAWGLNASYNLNDMVEGLAVHGSYVTGKVHPDSSDSWKEKEYNLGVSYQLPVLEGLSAHVMYAHNTQEDQGSDESGADKNLINKDTRIIVKYDIAVF